MKSIDIFLFLVILVCVLADGLFTYANLKHLRAIEVYLGQISSVDVD